MHMQVSSIVQYANFVVVFHNIVVDKNCFYWIRLLALKLSFFLILKLSLPKIHLAILCVQMISTCLTFKSANVMLDPR